MTTDVEIIVRAAEIIAAGPVKKPWDHGPFCPWCALAQAKGALETERGLPWDAYDGVLHLARIAIGSPEAHTFSQHEALERLQQAQVC